MKLPHCATGQVTVQATPALAGSFVTVAAILATAAMSMEEGGVRPVVKATEIGAAVIVMVAEMVLVLSVERVAVTVTVLPVGMLAGAV